jgi:hypothetical protein
MPPSVAELPLAKEARIQATSARLQICIERVDVNARWGFPDRGCIGCYAAGLFDSLGGETEEFSPAADQHLAANERARP